MNKRKQARLTAKLRQRLKHHGYAALGMQLDTSRQAVWVWGQSGRVDPAYVARLAPLIGMEPHEIRPDVFPAPERCGGAN